MDWNQATLSNNDAADQSLALMVAADDHEEHGRGLSAAVYREAAETAGKVPFRNREELELYLLLDAVIPRGLL